MLFVNEEIFVDPVQEKTLFDPDANAILDHQVDQLLPIDCNDSVGDVPEIV
jgi:hypothetical protein